MFFTKEVFPRLTAEIAYRGVVWTSENETHLRACCPLHGGDNRTAFCVSKKTLRWRCYTRCLVNAGSVLAYLNEGMEPRGRAYYHAILRAAELVSVEVPGWLLRRVRS